MQNEFRVGDWVVQRDQSKLVRGDSRVKIDPKIMDVLVHLAERAGQVVLKEDVIEKVWEGAFVTDEVLTNAVWELRKALGDDAKDPRYIRTVPRKGYRLIAPVEAVIAEPLQPEEALARVSKVPQWRVAVPWLVAVLVGGLAIWAFMRGPAPGPVAPSRFPLATAPLVTNDLASSVAISPDGTKLVYVAEQVGKRQLYLQEMGEMEATPIAGTENGRMPFFSPDGQWVGFAESQIGGKLKKISLLGGPPYPLCEIRGYLGAYWGPDDTIVFTTFAEASGAGIWRIAAAGGKPEPLIGPSVEEGEWVVGFPQVLPGGKDVLFSVLDGSLNTLRVEVLSLETGERKTLREGGNPARYAPSGHLVYAEGDSLLAAPFDLARLELTGAPVPVVDDVRMGSRVIANFSLSRNGTLVYVPGGRKRGGNLVWVDREGKSEPTTEHTIDVQGPRLSPKGDRIAMWIRGANPQVWVCEIERGALTPLTSEGQNGWPVWSPDGKRVVFPSMRLGSAPNLFWKSADGSGSAERLTTSEYAQQPYSWSSDGKLLFFHQARDPDTGWDVWVLPFGDDGKPGSPEPFLKTPASELQPALSPDGRWLAYRSNVSGRPEIYVTPNPGPGGKVMISTDGGISPAWAPSGQELFYRNREEDRLMVVDIVTEPELRPGKPRVLFEGPYERDQAFGRNYDVSSDGQRFVMIKPPEESVPQQINVVLNWFDELKRLVPHELT